MKINRVVPVALLATVMSATLVACASESPVPSTSPSPSPTPTRMPYTINHFYPLEESEACTVDLDIKEIYGSVEVAMVDYTRNDSSETNDTWWCKGSKHTWIGTNTFEDYTFSSDENTPLQFQVTSEGYLYLGGSGTVTEPDGTVVTLPTWIG